MAKIMRANGTIRRARFVNVDPADNNSCLEADANEFTIGISQIGGNEAPIPSVIDDPPNAAEAGQNVLIHTINSGREDVVLEIGTNGVTAGGELISDADGKGVAAATTGTTIQNVGAIALETAAAAELCRVLIVNYRVRPALS